MRKKIKYIIGVDEVGRGPLAGPVAVAAVALSRGTLDKWGRVKDSKQLSPARREAIFKKLKEQSADRRMKRKVDFAVSLVGNKIIDRRGIVAAVRLATRRVLNRLLSRGTLDVQGTTPILLDGSLRAPAKYKNQRTIIHGDETVSIIALASIIAKVTRDRKMIRLAKKFPGYGFEIHKGYGTKSHYQKLKKLGPSSLHRRTFLN